MVERVETAGPRGPDLLRQWRIETGVRQVDLAARLGVSTTKTCRIEQGTGLGPTPELRALLETVTAGAVPASSWRRVR